MVILGGGGGSDVRGTPVPRTQTSRARAPGRHPSREKEREAYPGLAEREKRILVSWPGQGEPRERRILASAIASMRPFDSRKS